MKLTLLIALTAAAALAAEKVEILRDEYGVPHIFALTPRGAAYASGFVQASDRSSELFQDLRRAATERHESELSPKVREIVDAYCAGINRYVAEHHPDSAFQIEPWMVVDLSRDVAGRVSNGNSVIVDPGHTASHAAIAIIDPLWQWTGPSAYQMVIASGEYSWVGAAPLGLPFPLEGHGYTSSVTLRDSVAGYQTLNRAWDLETTPDRLMQPPGIETPQAANMTRAKLDFNDGLTIYDALRIATSAEVYKADAWQKRIARVDAESGFARMITGWSRRADYDSREALAFYLFKMALGQPDSAAIEPTDSLSDNRIRAALRKAQDRFETGFPFMATFGTLFQIAGKPASGGSLLEAGMATPRAISYALHSTVMKGVGGQTATQIVEFARPVPKSYMLVPATAAVEFARGAVRNTYFGDRKELEKHVTGRTELVFQ